ncbi:MAG: hypothetical protein ACUVUU_09660 [bacterium]
MNEEIEMLSQNTRKNIQALVTLLTSEISPVAILLTGPQSMGIDNPDEKIYLLALVDDESGVIEHRFIEPHGIVDRHAEVGIFPQKLIEVLSQKGYWDMVTFRAAEAIRIAIPIEDPTGYGKMAIELMSRILPERKFISPIIHRIVATYDDAVSLFLRGNNEGAILVLREALRMAVDMVQDLKGITPDKSSEEIIREIIGEEGVDLLKKALAFDGYEEADVIKSAEEIRRCAKAILAELGIPDDLIEG